jgi:hypothetical protein
VRGPCGNYITRIKPAVHFIIRVAAGSNTSTVTLRVVGGDEKGSLKSETVKYGREYQGTRIRESLRWQGPAAYAKERPVLSSERAPHKKQDRNCHTVINIWSWAPDGARHQGLLTDCPSVAMWLWLWLLSSLYNLQLLLGNKFAMICFVLRKGVLAPRQGDKLLHPTGPHHWLVINHMHSLLKHFYISKQPPRLLAITWSICALKWFLLS